MCIGGLAYHYPALIAGSLPPCAHPTTLPGRQVVQGHKMALFAIRNFWKLLLRTSVPFYGIVRAFNRIEHCRDVADRTYKTMLERYPSNIRVSMSGSTEIPWLRLNAARIVQLRERPPSLPQVTSGFPLMNLLCYKQADVSFIPPWKRRNGFNHQVAHWRQPVQSQPPLVCPNVLKLLGRQPRVGPHQKQLHMCIWQSQHLSCCVCRCCGPTRALWRMCAMTPGQPPDTMRKNNVMALLSLAVWMILLCDMGDYSIIVPAHNPAGLPCRISIPSWLPLLDFTSSTTSWWPNAPGCMLQACTLHAAATPVVIARRQCLP